MKEKKTGEKKCLAVLLMVVTVSMITCTVYAGDLHDAVFWGDVAKVPELLEQGADVNSRDNYGETPLHKAAYRGEIEVAKLLLSLQKRGIFIW